jgi:hypothetical protein
MKYGDIVRHRQKGTYGTVEYSTFGYSIHFWDEENQVLGKTLGSIFEDVDKYWEVVDMPEGYEVMEWGGLRKIR